jgi:DNA-binding MarR family transcriptional regulator
MAKTHDPDPLWPPTDPLTASIQARLFALSRAIDAEIGRIAAENGLNTGELVILGALKRMGPPHQSTASDLQRLHWVSLPGLMKQLNRLEEQGLIEREVDPQDRRRAFVRLTRKAHAMFARLEHRPQERMFSAIWAMPLADRRRIHTALGDLIEAVRPPLDEAVRPPLDKEG